MDKEDFTSNEIIDNITIGDNTVDIVGYVVKVSNNSHSSNKSKFYKFVVSNGQGREVQITAWNEKIDILKQVQELGKIVYVGSAKASAIRDKKYNSGNVNFELLIKENSVVEVFDTYETTTGTATEEVSIVEALTKINQKIKVEGIVKTEFRKYKNGDFEFTVGSITDCNYKLEVKLNTHPPNINFKKGNSIEAIGVMEQYLPGPPVLKVESIDDLNIIDRERVSFVDILNGFRTKQ